MSKFFATAFLAVVVLAATAISATNPCAQYTTCNSCVAENQGADHCGWCSISITENGKPTGVQCASTRFTKFECPYIFSTDKCIAGYECVSGGCRLGRPGTGMPKAQCEAMCRGPTTPVPTASKVYCCDQQTHVCAPCPAGSPNATSQALCEVECKHISTAAPGPVAKVYFCEVSNFTCQVVPPGTPGSSSLQACTQNCTKSKIGYKCDPSTQQCSPNALSVLSHQQCEAECKNFTAAPPTTVPPEPSPPPSLLGLWRGIRIDNKYDNVEYDLNVTQTEVTFVKNSNPRVVIKGTPFHIRNSEDLAFWILVTSGPNTGKYIRTISDTTGEQGPENSFDTMAMAPAGDARPSSITDSMTNGVDMVFAWSKCIVGDTFCIYRMPPLMKQQQPKKQPLRNALANGNKKLGALDACEKYTPCMSCIAVTGCGWCSSDVIYHPSGTKGGQCAGLPIGNQTYMCPGTYSTTNCENDYICQQSSTGPSCVKTQPGNGESHSQCLATCRPTPPPNPRVKLYNCSLATHQCHPCPGNSNCPGSMPLSQCSSICSHPKPGPIPSMKNIYRGYFIENNYPVGVVELILNETGATMYYGSDSNNLGLYMTASIISLGSDMMIWTVTSPGANHGKKYSLLYQNAATYNDMYWQTTMTMSAPDGATPTYNQGMVTKGEKELLLTSCQKAPCKYAPPQ